MTPDNICTYKEMMGVQYLACIPAFNEASLLPVLESLNECQQLNDFGVIIVINASENASIEIKETNKHAFLELQLNFKNSKYWFPIYVALYNNLPAKKAGVGLARKLSMDKACELIYPVNKEAILLCLDADCTVEENWIVSIVEFFQLNKKINAASIYFEHKFPEDNLLLDAIILYELHLRYFKQALQFCGYPWYFHTVGSSMALRAEMYIKSGGMNTRQAGEDFYFLHKLMPLGFGEINSTTVYPQARYSDRVPFGTGRSMLEFQKNGELNTYNFNIFLELKTFFDALNGWNQGTFDNWKLFCSPLLLHFLEKEEFNKARENAILNTTNVGNAKERLLKWFSGFCIIKCIHYMSESGLQELPVISEASKLISKEPYPSASVLLEHYREKDRI